MRRKQEKQISNKISKSSTNSTLKQLNIDADKSSINKVTEKSNNDQKVYKLNNKNFSPSNEGLKKQLEINQHKETSKFLSNQFIVSKDTENKKQGQTNSTSHSKNKNKTSSNEKSKKNQVYRQPIKLAMENVKITQQKQNLNGKDKFEGLPGSSTSRQDEKKIQTLVKQKEKSMLSNSKGTKIKIQEAIKQNRILDTEKERDIKVKQAVESSLEPKQQVTLQSLSSKKNISVDDIKRIKFLKKLQAQKLSIQERLRYKKKQQEMTLLKQEEEKRRHKQLVLQEQRQKKRKSIQLRLQQISRRKQHRQAQLNKQNKQYQERKYDYTLQHKLINQWLQREMEQNLRKEKQLEEKISKMKPTNHLKSIQEHNEMIESYKVLHQSHFMQDDVKNQQYKSRLELQKLYKSQWYHQVKENDPLDTFSRQQQKQKEYKQILMMKLDTKKKYSEYVKANYKPDSNQDSVFNYQKTVISHLPAHKIRKMGIQNLIYSKQKAHNQPQKQSKTQTQRQNIQRRTDYLQQLKSTRSRKQSFSSQKNLYQMVTNNKSSNSLVQKVTTINETQQKIQKRVQEKQMPNRKNNSQLKSVNNQKKGSFLTRKSNSLPALNQKQLPQPKLKVISTQDKKNKVKNDLDGFLMEINQKFKILQKIV